MAGCTKKYTDPSSLRKHVKNHTVRDHQQPTKKRAREPVPISASAPNSGNNDMNNLSRTVQATTPSTIDVYNDLAIHIEVEPPLSPEDNNFIFDEMFYDFKKDGRSSQLIEEQSSGNAMNLQEMSKCIVTIQDDNTFSYNFEPTTDDNHFEDLSFEQQDEFVSIESIKKYLGEQNVDYIGSTLQSHLNDEYFNQI